MLVVFLHFYVKVELNALTNLSKNISDLEGCFDAIINADILHFSQEHVIKSQGTFTQPETILNVVNIFLWVLIGISIVNFS